MNKTNGKKIMSAVIVAVILVCAYIGIWYFNGQKGEESLTSAVHGTGVTEGVLDGNTYTLTGIGMELKIPDSFEVVSGKALDTQIKGGASVFFRFAARNNEQQEVLTLSVPNTTDKSAETYLSEARDTLKGQRNVIGKIEEIDISGFSFQSIRNEAKGPDGQALVELTLVYEDKGKLFVLNDLFPKEREDAVMQSLGEIITVSAPKAVE